MIGAASRALDARFAQLVHYAVYEARDAGFQCGGVEIFSALMDDAPIKKPPPVMVEVFGMAEGQGFEPWVGY